MARTLTWQEIEKDWAGLQKRHRMEIAQAVARYCVGHKMKEVAERLGYSVDWVGKQLDYAGVGQSLQESTGVDSLRLVGEPGKQRSADTAVAKVVSDFAPKVEVKYSGTSKDSIANIEGEDAEEFWSYVDHYIADGHEPAAAARLAKAEWAGEAAVEAGVIKETVNKRNEKVNQILFPNDSKDTFELDLKMHMARVESAARFLDEAKINFLRRKATCERVASANEKWAEQVDRILNLHPTLK